MKNSLSTLWFKYLTSHYLIYNSCWEDPQVDRFLLEMDSSSDVFMITSAGDNTFDYLLDSPNSIDCVDINPQQNFLLDLKYALFQSGNVEHLRALFLPGKTPFYKDIYASIRRSLNNESRLYWDHHIRWFSPGNGFYQHGLTGYFARFLIFLLKSKGIYKNVLDLIHETSLQKREYIFRSEIEPVLWSGISKHLWKSDLVLSLAGIPSTQRNSIPDLNEYMKRTLWNVFVVQGTSDNYFWRLYLEGKYTDMCCPNYLKNHNYEHIRSQLFKLSHSTKSVTELLNSSTKKYSHYVLLDHQDWLIGNGTNELEKEWRAILRSSKPNAKVLLRSVHKSLDFLPEFVKPKVRSVPIESSYLLQNDRVGTYPSTFLLEIHV